MAEYPGMGRLNPAEADSRAWRDSNDEDIKAFERFRRGQPVRDHHYRGEDVAPPRDRLPVNQILAEAEKLLHGASAELQMIECSLFGISARIADDSVKSRPEEDYPTHDRAEMLRGFAQALASRLASIRERL